MKKKEKILIGILLILLVVVGSIYINVKFTNKENVIQKQEISKGQLSETSGDNAYVSTQSHLAEVNAQKQQVTDLNTQISGTTVTADRILKGYTAYKDGQIITGTMANNGALSATLKAGGSYTIPQGYTTGGTIKATDLASQTQATATANNITKGKTAWINGKLITGTGKDAEEQYSQGVIDGQKNNNIQLLWENTSTSTTFASQTISLDLSTYDAIIISFVGRSTWNSKWYFTIPIGTSQAVNVYMNGDATNVGGNMWYRIVTPATDGVTIGNALDNVTCNDGVLPREIYGISNFN